jgi:glycosyltransferase involved in cell wall biosynthesis
MIVWLIKEGEYLPNQQGVRRMRNWMLADALVRGGATVTWFASTFSHQRKELLATSDEDFEVRKDFVLKMLHVGGYGRNISYSRLRYAQKLARRFRSTISALPSPDVIVCSFPLIEVAFEAVKYGREQRIPVVVDIRDLWPDTFLARFPRWLQGLGRCIFRAEFSKTRKLFKEAQGITAISQGILEWGLRYAGRPMERQDRVFPIGYPSLDHKTTADAAKWREAAAGKVVVTFIGSFGVSYELDLVCSVAEQMQRRGMKDVLFLLAGEGEQSEAIKARVRNLENVLLPGWLDRASMEDVLSVTHVGLIPSNMVVDAMPNKFFEYMSAGVPVVSSLRGELIGILASREVGLSYDCGSPEGLLKCLLILVDDAGLRKRMARNASRLFEEEFREDRIYDEFADFVMGLGQSDSLGAAQAKAGME